MPSPRYYYPVPKADPPRVIQADLCIYGGTPAGVAAAVQGRRSGRSVALFIFNRHVGGLTSAGLTATDVGNPKAIGGLATEFYQRVGKLRFFHPSEAEATFRSMLADAGAPIYPEHRLASVRKEGGRIVEIAFENGNIARGKVFIDATYEGDLFARAGVSFHVGRESNATYGETINGVQFHNAHNFNYPVDPWKVEGDPATGLLWGISPDLPGKAGEGDRRIQAYNFRMYLSDAPGRIPFPRPEGYDPARYELLLRYLLKKPDLDWSFSYKDGPFQLQNGDCNNSGGFSTDNIGRNYDWPEADYATRERIFQDHVLYQQGLMYYMANEPRVPKVLRDRVNRFGLDPREFAETGHWPHELYVREARRMVGDYVMTELNCRGQRKAEDSVGLASYTMDSHNCQRIVIDGRVRNEGDVQVPCPAPYPIAYRSIVPKQAECANLLVPVCLSSSHIAYGSIRMEPVFMILGQSAANAASLAIETEAPVQKVDYAALRRRLVEQKQVLDWP